MRVPLAGQLLDAWERGASETPTRRALSLLAIAQPQLSEGELAALPIGRRDEQLLQLRERLFGSQLLLVVPCPRCGQPLESQVRVDDLACDHVEAEAASYVAECDGHLVTFRLPASNDLMALSHDGDAGACRAHLIDRCLLEVRDSHGQQRAVSQLSDDVLADLCRKMEQADPAADMELAFTCPACGSHWQEMFDIASFLWREIHAWAQRTLRDVHILARAYGWPEADVLALSPTRRQIYLELCRQ
jgi:hypothetical protein